VTPGGLRVDGTALGWRFSRSSGAGGQHVNTSDTKVALTCELAVSGLPDDVIGRLTARHGSHITVVASDSRSQWRNRQIALERLAGVIDGAQLRTRPRRPTRPSRGATERRLEGKRQSSERKARRRWRPGDD
jgi:ribosome-associated protein